MKPLYSQLKRHHYSSTIGRSGYISADMLFAEIGYDYVTFIKQQPAYENTCAIRLSLALLKCNINFTGRMVIKNGPYKGKKVEPGAKLLADQLYQPHIFGKPEIHPKNAGIKAINGRKGLIFFNKIDDYGGGHIDLIEPINQDSLICNSSCYFSCKEVWFWELY